MELPRAPSSVVEHVTFNHGVLGSIPRGPTSKSQNQCLSFSLAPAAILPWDRIRSHRRPSQFQRNSDRIRPPDDQAGIGGEIHQPASDGEHEFGAATRYPTQSSHSFVTIVAQYPRAMREQVMTGGACLKHARLPCGVVHRAPPSIAVAILGFRDERPIGVLLHWRTGRRLLSQLARSAAPCVLLHGRRSARHTLSRSSSHMNLDPDYSPRVLSRLVRRVHMFTGLFLAPWMVMYAISTMVMTHHESVKSLYGSERPALVKDRELDYSRSFSPNLRRDAIAQQVLNDLGMAGAHSVSAGKDGRAIVIQRQHAMAQQRLTFDPSKSTITIEREEFHTPTILERLHRRRGYDHPYAVDYMWGFMIDVAVAAMVFWSLSGIWLAWTLTATRLWGALSFVVGWGLFVAFAALI
jgi:hypothetical protein